jgi:hypothetical protein
MDTARSGVELGRFPNTVKNRIHWDVYGDMDAFVAAGATVLADLPDGPCWATPRETSSACIPTPVEQGEKRLARKMGVWSRDRAARAPPPRKGQPLSNRAALA